MPGALKDSAAKMGHRRCGVLPFLAAPRSNTQLGASLLVASAPPPSGESHVNPTLHVSGTAGPASRPPQGPACSTDGRVGTHLWTTTSAKLARLCAVKRGSMARPWQLQLIGMGTNV